LRTRNAILHGNQLAIAGRGERGVRRGGGAQIVANIECG